MNPPELDPVFALVLRSSLAGILGQAALGKVRRPVEFRAALAGHRLIPDAWLGVAALVLPLVEGLTALGLLVPSLAMAASWVAGGLFVAFAVAVAVNVSRGRLEIACGCHGWAVHHRLSRSLVWRNAALACLAMVAGGSMTNRPMIWLDGISIVAGAACGLLLYGAIDVAIANREEYRALRAA